MKPHYTDGETTVYLGDCIEVMRTLPDASVDAVVTDPPYGLGFMGKHWDALPPGLDFAEEAYRVLKPGGHILAFGGSRTWHRLAVAIEDAGFELRDSIAWLYGSGFPKSMDVSKAIDKAAGAERVKIRKTGAASAYSANAGNDRPWMQKAREEGFIEVDSDTPATDAAREWEGWGTALKPAFEPIVVGRKPLVGTVAANVLEHRTGALNIDATRVATTDKLGGGHSTAGQQMQDGWERPWMSDPEAVAANAARSRASVAKSEDLGRWPTNVILDDSQAAALDAETKPTKSAAKPRRRDGSGSELGQGSNWNAHENKATESVEYGDSGGPSRFFPTFKYQAKAPKSERPLVDGVAHATVKPIELMRWLIRLVVPKGATILEPFASSGTTVEAAILEDVRVIAIEREAEYWPLIRYRIARGNGVL